MEPNRQQSKVTTELMAETASKYGLCVCMNPTIVSISVHHDSVNLGPGLGLSARAANCYAEFKLACHLAIYCISRLPRHNIGRSPPKYTKYRTGGQSGKIH